MTFAFEQMNLKYAELISKWRYDGIIEEIYVKPYFDNYNPDTKETKGPDNCDGFAVLLEGDIFGLFEYYFKKDIMEIGLALNPKYVNKGFGKDFVMNGIKFGIETFNYNKEYILLNVNKNNKPAIRVYEKCGFNIFKDSEDIEMRLYI